MITKILLRKQMIVSMSIINSERVMMKSNAYIANINRLLKEVKFNIFADYIHSNNKVIIIMTSKIAAILET